MNAVKWGAATELAQCKRCGKTGKVPAGSKAHGRNIFCSAQCEEWHNEELHFGKLDRQNARVTMARWAQLELLRTTPLHVLYPEMLDVIERVQSWRPSNQVRYRRTA